MKDLKKRYYEACQEFVDKEKLNEDVIGIVVCGSILHLTLDKNSDIDIHIVLSSKCQYRERGNIWIKGVEIEYFRNPGIQIRSYFEEEKKSPHTAHMLAYGKVVYSRSKNVDELVSMAKKIIKKLPPRLVEFELELEKYFLDDCYKDLEDAIVNHDRIGANLLRNKMVDRSINIFCRIHRIWRDKEKRISKQIEQIDPKFIENIELALSEAWNEVFSIKRLRTETEELLGGRRTKNWNLRSGLNL